VTEGTGWPGKVKLALYARMEELSFRSAVATAAGVLAITGLGVSLTVTSGGGHQIVAVPRGTAPAVVQSPAARSSPAGSLPSAEPSPAASPARVAPVAEYQPAAEAAPQQRTTTQPRSPQVAASTSPPAPVHRPVSRQPRRSPRSFGTGWPPAFLPPGQTFPWFEAPHAISMRPGAAVFGHR
jgi:hypothetical protein